MAALPSIGSAADLDGLPPVPATTATQAFLEARVEQDPLDYLAHNRLVHAYIQGLRQSGGLAFLEKARVHANASLAAVPAERNPNGLTALALVQFESHDFAAAVQSADRAWSIDSRDTTALAIAGDSQLELGHYELAGEIYDKLARDGLSPPILARQARLAEMKGDDAAALTLLETAGNVEPWYRLRRGEIHFRHGRLIEAEAEYVGAPETFAQLEHLAELRAAQERTEEAVLLYKRALKKAARAEVFQALGDLYAFTGNSSEAHIWWKRALAGYLESVAQGSAHYFHHLAGYYSDCEQNPAEALRWARRDIAVRTSSYAYDTLAWALYKNGEFAAAADAMTKALASGIQDPHILAHAGLIYARAGDLQKGRALLQQVAVIDPAYDRFHAHR